MKPQQIIDAIFAGLEANRFLRWIPGAEALVAKAKGLVASGELALKLAPTMTWQQVADALFAALEVALPSEVTLLKILQFAVDSYFTPPPKVA
jgi:hypothetical protein